MNDDHHPERDAAPSTAADPGCTGDPLARLKHRSLGSQALRLAWDLGAFLRRVEHEAPEAHRPIRDAVAALLRLAERAPRPGSPTQGELFSSRS